MEPSATSTQPRELPYAMPVPSYANKVMAGAAIVLAGLALMVVGGCFLIGVMIVSNRGFNATMAQQPMNKASVVLLGVLYVLAGISFFFGALVLLSGLRALFRVMRG